MPNNHCNKRGYKENFDPKGNKYQPGYEKDEISNDSNAQNT